MPKSFPKSKNLSRVKSFFRSDSPHCRRSLKLPDLIYICGKMLDVAVYLLFLALVFFILQKDAEKKYCALFLGILLFPSCIWIIDKPKLLIQHVFLYTFLCYELALNANIVKDALAKFPLKIPLFLILASFCATILTTQGLKPKEFYALARYILDLYGYLIAAYIVGCRINIESVMKKLYWPLIILGFLGVFEGLAHLNYPYNIICSAFPGYDGFYGLGSAINGSDSWRTRTFLTTTYPTAYGTLLCGIILFYIPNLKQLKLPSTRILLFCAIYAANLYLCGCRTAILCTGLALMFWLIKKWPVLPKIILIGAFCFGTVLYGASVVGHFSQETRGSSLQLRQQQLIFSVVQIANRPLFGNGLSYLTKHIFETDQYGERIRDPEIMGMESILFPKLINYGFVGLFTYYLFCAWMFFWFYSKRDQHPTAISGYLIIFAVTIFFTLSGNMGNASAYIYLILGLIMGNLVSTQKAQAEKEKTELLAEETAGEDIESE